MARSDRDYDSVMAQVARSNARDNAEVEKSCRVYASGVNAATSGWVGERLIKEKLHAHSSLRPPPSPAGVIRESNGRHASRACRAH